MDKISSTARCVTKILRSRRSVRRFTDRKPSSLQIARILESGRWAPSGLNNQPWRFLIVSDNPTKERLAALTKCGIIIRQAPTVIVVCLDTADSYNRDKDLMAIGACIQNMLLACTALGLGSCWLGEILNKKEDVRRCLRLESDLELAALIALGYPGPRRETGARKGKGRRIPLRRLMINHRL